MNSDHSGQFVTIVLGMDASRSAFQALDHHIFPRVHPGSFTPELRRFVVTGDFGTLDPQQDICGQVLTGNPDCPVRAADGSCGTNWREGDLDQSRRFGGLLGVKRDDDMVRIVNGSRDITLWVFKAKLDGARYPKSYFAIRCRVSDVDSVLPRLRQVGRDCFFAMGEESLRAMNGADMKRVMSGQLELGTTDSGDGSDSSSASRSDDPTRTAHRQSGSEGVFDGSTAPVGLG